MSESSAVLFHAGFACIPMYLHFPPLFDAEVAMIVGILEKNKDPFKLHGQYHGC